MTAVTGFALLKVIDIVVLVLQILLAVELYQFLITKKIPVFKISLKKVLYKRVTNEQV